MYDQLITAFLMYLALLISFCFSYSVQAQLIVSSLIWQFTGEKKEEEKNNKMTRKWLYLAFTSGTDYTTKTNIQAYFRVKDAKFICSFKHLQGHNSQC